MQNNKGGRNGLVNVSNSVEESMDKINNKFRAMFYISEEVSKVYKDLLVKS